MNIKVAALTVSKKSINTKLFVCSVGNKVIKPKGHLKNHQLTHLQDLHFLRAWKLCWLFSFAALFFKKKLFQEYSQCQTVWTQIRPDILIWVQILSRWQKYVLEKNHRYVQCVLINFSLTVKAATLIFIYGPGSAISSTKEGKSGLIYNLVNNW